MVMLKEGVPLIWLFVLVIEFLVSFLTDVYFLFIG